MNLGRRGQAAGVAGGPARVHHHPEPARFNPWGWYPHASVGTRSILDHGGIRCQIFPTRLILKFRHKVHP
jgi:hypothetical protein